MADIRNENFGCNVIGGPVYGGTFVAGRNARVTAMPRPANPLDQRPALVIAHLPWQMKTPRAIGFWQQLYDEGFVNNECMTLRGRADSAMMAQRLARALDIREVWKTFEQLWGISNLHGSLNKALDTDGGWRTKEVLDRIFGKEK